MNEYVKLSPMMEHYQTLKKTYGDAILMYRLGDFFEMFFEDALVASKILDLTLTGRDGGLEKRVPMCGVPHHAVDNYIARLTAQGLKVAICEQLSNAGDQKGMVKRDVVRVITPGTNTNEEVLDAATNNFLASVSCIGGGYAVALLDITTGEFLVKSFENGDILTIEDYILKNNPAEIIAPSKVCSEAKKLQSVENGRTVRFTPFYDYSFEVNNAGHSLCEALQVFDLDALGLKSSAAISAAGGLIEYVENTQKRKLPHINALKKVDDAFEMGIDYNTVRNLELVETTEGKRYGSMLSVIDKTKTAMGQRKLRSWVLHPLQDVREIEQRQTAIGELIKNVRLRSLLASSLTKVKDIERLVTKLSYRSAMPRDLLALAVSLQQIPVIKGVLADAKSNRLNELLLALRVFDDLAKRITSSICAEPPATLKDGGYIKSGCNAELDKTRKLKDNIRETLKKFEDEQRILTGVPNLKVGYNRIFGYYIEIPNSKKTDMLPYQYIRRQTVATGERYVCDTLLRLEKEILGAADRCLELENQIYTELIEALHAKIADLKHNAEVISVLDALYSLAETASQCRYVKPTFNQGNSITIVEGRHPVVEGLLKANEFVPNDTVLNAESSVIILTGPNMAGKSTYIKQNALITILAHMGSFVPASKAEFCIVDKIFTRVGASDNLVRGQSTFMVEMLEAANILNNATSKSLLILDEIGRGTSTLDGLSLAWAIVEYVLLKIKAKTLFATHYHELNQLEEMLKGVKNFRVLINESGDKIAFLYKISRGSANRSFGIEVAALAGVKKEVISRAKNILNMLSDGHTLALSEKMAKGGTGTYDAIAGKQMTLFETDPTFEEIKKILTDVNINRCTPIEALTILDDLKKLLKK